MRAGISQELVHPSFVFLQEVVGVQEKLTEDALFEVTNKELLTSALPGKAPKQAPGYPTVLLAAVEDNVVDLESHCVGGCSGGGCLFNPGGHSGLTTTEESFLPT